AFVGEAVPKEKTGSAMGLLGTTSAIGTALGPSLGGILIDLFGWPALFLVNVPLGLVAVLLVGRHLPADRASSPARPGRFDLPGTLLLALTLAAYALALTLGRGHPGVLNAALLATALAGGVLFVLAESRVASPLIRLALFRNPLLGGGFASSALVTTIVMATLVVGPFYLTAAFALDAAGVGLVMSTGPIVAALTGFPAGRLVDRFGADRMVVAALVVMVVGTALLAALPAQLGIAGYVVPLLLVTGGYAAFQTANNTGVMKDVALDQRGLVSALLNLSRNLGLITGASLMGAVFALGSTLGNGSGTPASAAQSGLHLTFACATALVVLALVVTLACRAAARRH
nr:MFS transporter [Dokdonella sp.]